MLPSLLYGQLWPPSRTCPCPFPVLSLSCAPRVVCFDPPIVDPTREPWAGRICPTMVGYRFSCDGYIFASGFVTPGGLLSASSFGTFQTTSFSPGGGYMGLDVSGNGYDQIVTGSAPNLNGVFLQLGAVTSPADGSASAALSRVSEFPLPQHAWTAIEAGLPGKGFVPGVIIAV